MCSQADYIQQKSIFSLMLNAVTDRTARDEDEEVITVEKDIWSDPRNAKVNIEALLIPAFPGTRNMVCDFREYGEVQELPCSSSIVIN